MARFFVDENVAVELARELVRLGHDAVTTREAGRIGEPDDAQLTFAAQEQRTLITHNRKDFMLLHSA